MPIVAVAADATPTASVHEKAPAAAWYALAVLIGTTLFAFVDRQILNLIAPSLQRDLEISDLQLGIIHGLGLAHFASAAAYPIGWLSDRYGRRLVLGCCIVLWSIATAACAFQSSFIGVFTAAAGIAIGEAALTPIIFSMMPDLFPERQRNTANFIFFGAALLGAAVGLGLGGVTLSLLEKNHQALPDFLESMASWRVALVLVAAPGPLFVLLLATIRMGGNSGRIARPAFDDLGSDLDHIRPFVRKHWRPFACIYGAIFAYTMPLSAAFAWLPVAMPRMFAGVEASAIGVPLGVAVGIGTLVGLILPPLGLKLLGGDATIRPLRLASMFLAAASIPALLMLFAWEPWHFYVLIGTQLAAVIATGALMPGVLQQLSPPNLRSRLISFLGISVAVGSGLSPTMVGAMSGVLDPHRGLLVAIVAVSLPGWVGAALLMSASRKSAAATIATIRAA
jgi:MFS family permease